MRTIIDRITGRQDRKPAALLAECASCPGHCCKNDAILLHPEFGDLASLYVTEELPHPLTGEPARMLAHKPNGDCVYLAEVDGVGRCSIYHRRPAICRSFDCGLAFARTTRGERRRMIRDGIAGPETFEQGRRVQARRASEKAQEAD